MDGIIISGAVTFEDRTVNTNRIHVAINESTSTKAYNYFPEYSGFFFAAEFEESHSDGCCEEEEETSRSISARVEAYGTRGQSVSVPPRYNVEMGRFEGWYELPDWAPEALRTDPLDRSRQIRDIFLKPEKTLS